MAGTPISDALNQKGLNYEKLRETVEHEVRYANITIIEGNQASQFGIGMVSARIAEMVLRDERAVVPIGSFVKSAVDFTVSTRLLFARFCEGEVSPRRPSW